MDVEKYIYLTDTYLLMKGDRNFKLNVIHIVQINSYQDKCLLDNTLTTTLSKIKLNYYYYFTLVIDRDRDRERER